MLLALHKPYGVVSQFTADGSGHRTLADFNLPAGVYPIGRLDADSEGLLLFSDEPGLNARLLHPSARHPRVYWAQVEGIATDARLEALRIGVRVQNYVTLPAQARVLSPQPLVAPRDPPVRFRKSIPTTWIELELVEGKNRQVRHMTAAVGFPTLRLIRQKIGAFELGSLAPGQWLELTPGDRLKVLGHGSKPSER